METFRGKIFNPEVFEFYRKKIESTKENSLIKNALFTSVNKYGAKLEGQVGGYTITEPILGRIDDSEPANYDGNTDAPEGKERKTFYQRKVTYGRQMTWGEYDFPTTLAGSKNFMPEASEVNEYWDEQLQITALAMLKGIANMTSNNFSTSHTYDTNSKLTDGSAELAAQAVLGDKKSKVTTMYMNSKTATNLNILNLMSYMKYTDSNGIERDLQIGTYNGKTVIVDDDMPVETGYVTTTADETGALEVVSSGASTGQINLADVKKGDYYPSGVAAGDYVKTDTRYTTYMLASGFFEREELSVPVRDEVVRDAYDKGGHNDLISRIREIIVPKYISYIGTGSYSPKNDDFANSANWEVAHTSEETPEYVPDKLIPFVRIYSREN